MHSLTTVRTLAETIYDVKWAIHELCEELGHLDYYFPNVSQPETYRILALEDELERLEALRAELEAF